MRAAIRKFRSDPTKSAVEKARVFFRQRQERKNNSDSAIQRRQMDVNRKRKAKQKAAKELIRERELEAARRKASNESELLYRDFPGESQKLFSRSTALFRR